MEPLFSVSIHDCKVETFRAGGKGGQHQNTTETGVRITHEPSGAVGESRETRSQVENKRRAFKRMAESQKFKQWARVEAARRSGQPSIEEVVCRQMRPENILVDVKDENGNWTRGV